MLVHYVCYSSDEGWAVYKWNFSYYFLALLTKTEGHLLCNQVPPMISLASFLCWRSLAMETLKDLNHLQV